MHVLQRLPLKNFFSVLPSNGLGVVDLLLKKKLLGMSGGQLSLRQDQGGCGGLRVLLRFS